MCLVGEYLYYRGSTWNEGGLVSETSDWKRRAGGSRLRRGCYKDGTKQERMGRNECVGGEV